MDNRIKELTDMTKKKFGLAHYYLERYTINRHVTLSGETVYTLTMEWLPNHTEKPEDDTNPEGAAVIEMNVHSRKFVSAIFVMDKTFAENGICFAGLGKDAMINWMEKETGLMYGNQLALHKEEEGRLLFKTVMDDGIEISPSGYVEIKYNEAGELTFFTVHGQFPSNALIRKESYTLSFDKVENIAKEQLKLIEFPSYEQEKRVPVYVVEEVFITNSQMTTLPFEVGDGSSYLNMDQTVYFDNTVKNPIEIKEINWTEEVTAEQAFVQEPSPDAYPITKNEQEKCIQAVKDLLLQEYPDDSGNWILKTLHRDKGYIYAILRTNQLDKQVFQRKLTVIIDAASCRAVNYVDNKSMLDMFDQFQAAEKPVIDKEEAYQKLKTLYELKPYYVYDFEQKQYILCGKIDCQYGVHASSGEVIALNEV
ncbi:hypothetical protein [Oceanobacillus timonensis]|uniref:hypothetical protein n=1 Tax=Oceanobacillus timonensis TaxID=1926285 RepID=UPI0009BACCB7|nr:hypothetical protein [Oceanobacillus timonensis]